MSYLEEKINTFFKKKNEIFKKPLEKIIKSMLDKCKYINGESLERHNWGNIPIKLNHIPKNINLPSFESDLLNALNLEENEKSIVELLWGDIQLGKRVQACIIMWDFGSYTTTTCFIYFQEFIHRPKTITRRHRWNRKLQFQYSIY